MPPRKNIEYKEDAETGCHICTSHKIRPDGSIPVKKGGAGSKRIALARLIYEKVHGSLEEGQIVYHTCNTPSCINPDHLKAGSQANKIAQQVADGRNAIGSRNGRAKLTEEMVRDIRKTDSSISSSELARTYGVDHKVISRIRSGLIWKHVKVE
jgi:hypothetical protein